MMATRIGKKLIDIGANLTDGMFQGVYFQKNHHPPDLSQVLQRSGCDKIMVTGGTLDDSRKALELAKTEPFLYCTAGFHPTRCLELEQHEDPESQIDDLIKLCQENRAKVVAVGEFGLDYDRLEFCPKDVQRTGFDRQFRIAEQTRLPLFLHCRNAADDLLEMLRKNRDRFRHGVVHSFDGTLQEAMAFIDLGLYIGLNGCSMKTDENLEVIRRLPDDRLMIETDCPYCEIKPSHASFKYVKTKFATAKKEKWSADKLVKGRNEPCNLVQVLECVAGIKNMDQAELADRLHQNTMEVFFASSDL